MKNILIVHALPAYVFGGGEKVTLDLIDNGFKDSVIWFAVVKPGGLFAKELANRNIFCVDIPIQGTHTGSMNAIPFAFFLLKNISGCISLTKFIKSHHIDLIYTTTRGGLIASSLAGWFTRTPVVSHFHDLPRKLWLYAWFAHLGSKAVIVPSNFVQREFLSLRWFGKSLANRILVVYNGLDINRFVPNCSSYRIADELSLNGCYPVILSAGRVQVAKGQDIVIAAAPGIIASFPKAAFIIVGDYKNEPEYFKLLINKINSLGLENHFHFLGFRQDLPDLISAADLIVSTSRAETFGVTVQEAMALAKPIIATDVGGICEQIHDGETGFLIPKDSYKILAEKVIFCSQNPDIMQKIGRNARLLVENKFTQENFLIKMEYIFNKVMT